jgi:YfiH family protein
MIMKQASNLLELNWLEHGFYNALESATVASPILMQQVHSADVLYLQKTPDVMPQVDAFVTNQENINLTVKTADCAPVLLADPVTRQVAAVHAGWRGAFQGVLENAILSMVEKGTRITDIRAAVGPHLQADSFIVDHSMKSLFPVTENHFFSIGEDGLSRFDFDAYVCYRLRRSGVLSVESVGGDTYVDQTYYSYRREPENTGRQFSCIMIKGEEYVK